jgi:hypothetical protein
LLASFFEKQSSGSAVGWFCWRIRNFFVLLKQAALFFEVMFFQHQGLTRVWIFWGWGGF